MTTERYPIPTTLLDLGFAMGRIEEGEDGEPMLTVVTPGFDTQPASSVVISGWGTLEALGVALVQFCEQSRGSPGDVLDFPIDNPPEIG